MKQKHDKFHISSMRINSNRASRYKILVACIVLAMSLSTTIHAESVFVTVGTDSLHFSTTFLVIDYGGCSDHLKGYKKAWNPHSSCVPKPTDIVTKTKSFNDAHFKILSPDGSCVLLNGRLVKAGSHSEGLQPLEMTMPINQTLTESDFIFDSTSYFASLDISWQEANFQVERGQSYIFQVTEQTQNCSPLGVGERTTREQLVALPCQTDDCCIVAGDANNDGVFSVLDLTFLIDYFNNDGPDPVCFGEADANGDCSLAEDDLDYMIASIFTGGPDPICPSP